jgi:hypothetical protein
MVKAVPGSTSAGVRRMCTKPAIDRTRKMTPPANAAMV